MTTSEAAFDKRLYHQQISSLWTGSQDSFSHLVRSYLFFHIIFLTLLTIELVSFLLFFAIFPANGIFALQLGLFFLTLFSFLALRLYFQAKKPEKIENLVDEYVSRCKKIVGYLENIPEHAIALASALQKFAANLHEKEYSFFSLSLFPSLTPTLEKFSCFCYWKDLHEFKELLLSKAVEEHLKAVKCEPTNLEVHAALANAYVMLSSLYADPRKYHGHDENKWVSPERSSQKMQNKFRAVAERAIEEFKILHHYAPDDPWVHVQLAYSYHDLQMPEEEIREYETVLKLMPGDKDTLFKLGMLYFQEGKNAQGLRIYDILKRTNYKKAENLIKFYGSYDLSL